MDMGITNLYIECCYEDNPGNMGWAHITEKGKEVRKGYGWGSNCDCKSEMAMVISSIVEKYDEVCTINVITTTKCIKGMFKEIERGIGEDNSYYKELKQLTESIGDRKVNIVSNYKQYRELSMSCRKEAKSKYIRTSGMLFDSVVY